MFASEFSEIPTALAENEVLRVNALTLIREQPIPGKILEDHDSFDPEKEISRLDKFRSILISVFEGNDSIDEAIEISEVELSRETSPHADNIRVFPIGWAERQVRTQVSRFYNQAVLRGLQYDGIEECFVPHSTAEDSESKCSAELAGKNHSVEKLLYLLDDAYGQGNFSKELKIPNHPHCTHVVTPLPN